MYFKDLRSKSLEGNIRMKYLVGQKRMKEIDAYTIYEIGLPSMVLMERAALKVFEYIRSTGSKQDSIVAICGVGNNGGDGIAVARLLHGAGFQVAIYMVGNQEYLTEDAKKQLQIATNSGVSIIPTLKLFEYTIIVDAIFGIGLSRPISGEYQEIIEKINERKGSCHIISIDIPSGIHADDGKVMEIAVQADTTVTFGFDKIGLHMYPGNEYAGKVILEDIGIPMIAYQELQRRGETSIRTMIYDEADIQRFPKRRDHSNKGTFGTVVVVAGSKNMCGAAYLSAKAALRMGAGLVKIMTVEENRIPLQQLLPEAVLVTYNEDSLTREHRCNRLMKVISSASAVVVGPGLGQSVEAELILDLVLKTVKVPVIIDADAINLLSKRLNQEVGRCDAMEDRIQRLAQILPRQTILTPHMKEFSRLLHQNIPKIIMNFIDTMQKSTYNNNLTYVIKDSITNVIQGNERYINTTGNHGLATGGAGDVLTGIIAGLKAQSVSSYEAACFGVYLHGLTACEYAKDHGTYSLIASDIIDSIATISKK